MMNDPNKQRQAIPVISYDPGHDDTKQMRIEMVNADIEAGRVTIPSDNGPRNLPPLSYVADAVAHELEQLAKYLANVITLDDHVQTHAEARGLGKADLNASLSQRLGHARGAIEVAVRNVKHQAGLLKEAK